MGNVSLSAFVDLPGTTNDTNEQNLLARSSFRSFVVFLLGIRHVTR